MKITIDILEEVNEALSEQMGLRFPPNRFRDLEQGLRVACSELGLESIEECLEALRCARLSRARVEQLAAHLTVGETYFFREKKSFDALEEHILPELIGRRRSTTRILRFWCAGCSSGEEPYSLAILLQQLIPDWKDWNITILGTDINPAALRKAETGIYRNWSFRGRDAAFKKRYFEPESGGRFRIKDNIRKMVRFAYLNLAETESYPSLATNTLAMDLVFCRNVLMYFSTNTILQVTGRFFESIIERGWVLTSPSEASRQFFPEFDPVNFPETIFFRKPASRPEVAREETPRRPAGERRKRRRPATVRRNVAPATGETPETEDDLQLLLENGAFQTIISRLHGRDLDASQLAVLARAWANSGDLPNALACCEEALLRDRVDVSFHYLKAGILHELGKQNEAVATLRNVLFLDRHFAMAHFTLASVYRQQGNRREARRHFSRAEELLAKFSPDELPPEGEGLTAGRLQQIAAANRRVLDAPSESFQGNGIK